MLRERIFTEPASFLLGCLVWIPLTIWIVSMVRWMVTGELDTVFGLLGVSLALVLGYIAIVPPAPFYSFASFVAVTGTVVMFPFLRASLQKRNLRAIDLEDLIRAHDALRARPDNMAAKFKIARLLYDMGYPGHALRIAEACIATMPQAFFLEEHRLVSRWRITPTHPSAFNPLPCIECSHPNIPGNVYCAACGAPYLLDRVRGKLLPAALAKKLMTGWAAMVFALILLPVIGSIGGLVSFFGVILLMVASLAFLLWLFKPAERATP